MLSSLLQRSRLALGVAALVAISACGGTATTTSQGASPSSAPQLATSARPPAITISPTNGSSTVNPDSIVTVDATGGALNSVTVTQAGTSTTVPGSLTPDGSTWTATGSLIPGTTYSVKASATSSGGATASDASTFTTTGGQHLITQVDPSYTGEVVGIGMPIKLVFNTPIAPAQQAALVSRIQVQSTPPVVGGWHWFSATEVHWRPENFWPSGTKVTVNANLAGFDAGNGYWGYANWSTYFTIGASHITKVDQKTFTLTAYDNGKAVFSTPVSLGKAGYPTISGTLVVWYKAQSVLMNSCLSGIDCVPGTANYYDENVYWDTAISTDGFFIHDAYWDSCIDPGSYICAQGHFNYSHGCVNISAQAAQWYFKWSQVGDIVEVSGTSRVANAGDGEGDWQIPYSQWANSGTVPA